MRRSTKKLLAAAVVAAFPLMGLVSPGAAATTPPTAAPVQPPGIAWTACTDPVLVYYQAQCGFVTAPLDYARPHGPTIQLAVSRILHTAPDAGYQGVMLVNPGGPGGSGLDLADLGQFIPNGAGTTYDWIGVDPRGVGSSRPALSCDPNRLGADRPNYVPTSTKELDIWLERSRRYAHACEKAQPALLRHLTTVDQARDIDTIRQALGVSQINYYGYSFGTYLGSVYNTLFPGRVRRAVFDSNVDPRNVWYQTNINQDLIEQHSMRLFWDWIAQHNDIYQLGTSEIAVEINYYDLRAQLLAQPAAGVVGPDELDDAFDQAAYNPQYWWPFLAEDWANYVHHGDTYYLVLDYQYADNPGNDNLYAVYNATECTDAPWPPLTQQLADAYRIQPVASFYTWTNFWFNAPCLYWPAPANAPVQIRGGTLAPLIVDDFSDGATPYPGDLEVRRLYPNGSLIGAPGSNHGVSIFYGNTCIDDAVAAYLAAGTLPARKPGNTTDSTCSAMPTPVPVTYAGKPPASPSTKTAQTQPSSIAGPRTRPRPLVSR